MTRMDYSTTAILLLRLYATCRVIAEPHSKPYIPFRTNPKEHPFVKHIINWDDDRSSRLRSQVKEYNVVKEHVDKERCPLQFTLGVSHRSHHKAQDSHAFSIVKPAISHPVFPARGPGRQLIHTTLYEHLDLLSPETSAPRTSKSIIKEGLIQHQEFPLLFESSSFAYSSPIIHDVNGDGIPDAIVSDYDGGIYIVGLHQGKEGRRWFHKAQVPRIFIRRSWIGARLNETYKDLHPDELEGEKRELHGGGASRDPYHSYFEYSSGNYAKNDVLRGVTGNVLGQRRNDLDALRGRRRKGASSRENGSVAESNEEMTDEELTDESQHRRLQEVQESKGPRPRLLGATVAEDGHGLEGGVPRRLQEVDNEDERRRREQKQREEEDTMRREREETRQKEEVEEEPRKPEAENEAWRRGQQKRVEEEVGWLLRAEEVLVTEQPQEEQQRGERLEEKRQHHQQGENKVELAVNANEQPLHQGEVNANPDTQVEDQEVGMEGGGEVEEAEEAKERSSAEAYSHTGRDDDAGHGNPSVDDEFPSGGKGEDDKVPDYGYADDTYGGRSDDYYGRYRSYRDDYYDEKHYVRINPHILSTPTLAEVPKPYGNEDEVEDMLYVPVSYYFDEDEYEGHLAYKRFENTDAGDETEVQRGMYVASGIMIYQLGNDPRWGRQEHLDLSSDHSAPQNATLLGKIPLLQDNTRMGAFALSRPAVADIDGDGKLDVLIGTSMGIVYAFDATHMTMKYNWPIQMQHAVESPVVVEDIAANTKLETLVSDIGGNVACFDEDANKVWHRDLHAAVGEDPSSVRASSPMSLGDVDGDGVLDVVVALQIAFEGENTEKTFVFAMNGANGADLPAFPLAFDTPASLRGNQNEDWIHRQLPGLLLVDLHEDQSHISEYIRRNGTKWKKPERSPSKPGGGSAPGLHVVLAVGETLYIIEAGSGCIQNVGLGEDVLAQVQADDVHGTNNLDLVISTASGNIITMASSSPFHPLNVWNNGEFRGRLNNYAHGYSSSQGIFFHAVSREYRDIFGVFVPVTFEIFDNRPNIQFESEKKIYKVEIRDGASTKRAIWRNTFNTTGVYTERLYIPHGAGYYTLMAQLRTTNGIVYEDVFHIGYNVNYMDGFGLMLWFPLLLAAITVFLGSSRNVRWDAYDYESRDGNGGGLGILG